MNVVITGSQGFIGKNLTVHLQQIEGVAISGIDLGHTDNELRSALASADFVFHLAGINRPKNEQEFTTGNVDFTQQVCDLLTAQNRPIPIVLSSSIQATRANPYGMSKKSAEVIVADYGQATGSSAYIYRLPNVFGKWCRPNYNSVVATFCHNIANELPITISDRANQLTLVYIDDVVEAFAAHLNQPKDNGTQHPEVATTHQTTLGELADLLTLFRQSRRSLHIADLGNPLIKKLYATYLSYLATDDFAYDLHQRCDPRGCLAEFVKSEPFGQIFVSRTVPGITRGNHYHHLKTEKFLVLEGDAIVRFRHILDENVIEYPVKGSDFRVVDIPPGYTHSIENVGSGELVTLFWASEIFNPEHPDTTYLTV